MSGGLICAFEVTLQAIVGDVLKMVSSRVGVVKERVALTREGRVLREESAPLHDLCPGTGKLVLHAAVMAAAGVDCTVCGMRLDDPALMDEHTRTRTHSARVGLLVCQASAGLKLTALAPGGGIGLELGLRLRGGSDPRAAWRRMAGRLVWTLRWETGCMAHGRSVRLDDRTGDVAQRRRERAQDRRAGQGGGGRGPAEPTPELLKAYMAHRGAGSGDGEARAILAVRHRLPLDVITETLAGAARTARRGGEEGWGDLLRTWGALGARLGDRPGEEQDRRPERPVMPVGAARALAGAILAVSAGSATGQGEPGDASFGLKGDVGEESLGRPGAGYLLGALLGVGAILGVLLGLCLGYSLARAWGVSRATRDSARLEDSESMELALKAYQSLEAKRKAEAGDERAARLRAVGGEGAGEEEEACWQGVPKARRVHMHPCGVRERLVMRFTVEEIQNQLKAQGDSTAGVKAELIRRLVGAPCRQKVTAKTLAVVELLANETGHRLELEDVLDAQAAQRWLRKVAKAA